MIDELDEQPVHMLDGDAVRFVAPLGAALVMVTIAPTCREGDRLRAASHGAALTVCRCALARLLADAGTDESSRCARLAALVFADVSELDQ